jgi:hypothetical protein
LPMAGKLVGPGESIGQNLPGRSALRNIGTWFDCVRDRRAVLYQFQVRIVAAAVQRESRVFGHYTNIAPKPHLVLDGSILPRAPPLPFGMRRHVRRVVVETV